MRYYLSKSINEKFYDLNIPKRVSTYMQRNNISKEKAREYLYPVYEDLHDYRLIDNMTEALKLTFNHLELGHIILIVGDYDVDGLCGGLELYKGLNKIAPVYDSKILIKFPNREEGYGLNLEVLKEYIKKQPIDLLITIDNGIKSEKEIAYIKGLGIDVIVLDHHTPDLDHIPAADAVVDLQLYNATYPFKELCGAGLAFKYICGLYDIFGIGEIEAYELITYAAIGTIADAVPLIDENRTIAKLGIEKLNSEPPLSIQLLLKELKIENKITAGDIGYNIAPCLNAAGRLYLPDIAFELLNCNDLNKGIELAKKIVSINNERKTLLEKYQKIAYEQIEKIKDDYVYILNIEDCPEGIIGLVAGNIKEEFNKPAIVFSKKDNKLKASARSIEALHIYNCLDACKEHILAYGGHSMAAGLTILASKFEDFKASVLLYAKEHLKLEDFNKKVFIEDEIDLNKLPDLLVELSYLEPFGIGNEEPLFITKFEAVQRMYGPKDNCKTGYYQTMGDNNQHVKIFGKIADCIGFKLSEYFFELNSPNKFYAIFTPEFNVFNNKEYLQLRLFNLHLSNPLLIE